MLFECSKLGVYTISRCLPTLTTMLNLTRARNNMVRPTTIRTLKRNEVEDRNIVTLTGQVTPTLKHYDPVPDFTPRKKMATYISSAGAKSLSNNSNIILTS